MLRWQQTFNVGYVPNNVVPKVFMAVSLDLRDDPNGCVEIFESYRAKYRALPFLFSVSTLELNLMLVIDYHVPV